MENNKILIGVQFIDTVKQEDLLIELIILRDLSLLQLIEGIKYGLAKRQDEFSRRALDVFNRCNVPDTNGKLQRLTLTSHNSSCIKEDENGRAIILVDDMNKKIEELGFISSTRLVFDPTGKYKSYKINTELIASAFSPSVPNHDNIHFPDYNISTRLIYRFNTDPVEIIPPKDPPEPSDQTLFHMLFPMFIMLGVMLFVRGVMMPGTGASGAMIMLTVAMSVATIITTIFNWKRQKTKFRESLEKWRKEYEEYISNTISEIKLRQQTDSAKLNDLYPDVNDLISYDKLKKRNVYSLCDDIYSRSRDDKDFLTIRLGISDMINNMFDIKGAKKDVVFSSAGFRLKSDKVKIYLPEDKEYSESGDKTYYLTNLPNYISTKYRFLPHSPYLFSLKNCGMLGIVGKKDFYIRMMIEKMIFEICYYHSPEDVQFVILFDPPPESESDIYIENRIGCFKFMPHFRGLFYERSQFVFNSFDANNLFGEMMSIMAQRASDAGRGGKHPHIVFIAENEYGIKEHAFSQFFPNVMPEDKSFTNEYGITFIFPKDNKEHLPHCCNYIIETHDDGRAEIIPRNDLSDSREILLSVEPKWNTHMHNASKILSAICYSQITANAKVPSSVTFFELYGFTRNTIDIGRYWTNGEGHKRLNIAETLAVPLGMTDSGITYLDLHENYDGPHMLVAGTTGSGKSETILTYLLGLCIYFKPEELNLMLVDMKGGGFINRIGTLPHVVGKVTDVDGDENGTGAEYMLKRFLEALKSEIKRRKLLFNSMYVDSIDQYIEACRNIEKHIVSIDHRMANEERGVLSETEKACLRKQATENKLAHLVLVVDEFTELKRFTTENKDIDFIGEMTTIARVGRSLGFHMILISQNIEGAITDDIRVNSKSRICLKVATRQASKEMLGTDVASRPEMPGHGRAYLLVGTGSKFEYFQSAYTGSIAEESFDLPVEIMEASKSGGYKLFYNSERDNITVIKRKEMLSSQGKLETQLNRVVGAIKSYYEQHRDECTPAHIIFHKPLPADMVYESGRVYEERDGRYEVIGEI